MKRIYLIILACMAVLATASAQELTVKQMILASGDLTASTERRPDINGKPCALVKVQLPSPGAVFEGNVIQPVDYKTNEYWVYMTEGSKELHIKHPNFQTLMVNFPNYGIKGLQSLGTYRLSVIVPQAGSVPVDDGMRYLALTVEPTTATVYVDNQQQQLTNGTVNVLLSQGQHTYRIEASGYGMEQGTVMIGDQKVSRTIKLQSVQAQLTVSCGTSGAQIFVNDQQRGTSPWTGHLIPGNYAVEARLSGYRPQRQTITLQQSEQRTVKLPDLLPITGNLNVNYTPNDAEVWLDGKKLGTTPDVFRGVPVGSHSVEIRKAGYQAAKQSVTIAEGQTAQLSGTLTAAAVASTSNSGYTAGAAVETFTVNGVSFKMVRVDGGTFTMGATKEQGSDAFDYEKPAHQVTLSTYCIGETEVTQALWQKVMDSNPSEFKGDNLPVEMVSWEDCQTFINKLNQLTGKRFRLPTEAEWEYAARGGNKSQGYKYSGSNSIDDVAWYGDNSGKQTHAVKSKQPNELGIYDMSGNVWEWCQDWWGSYSSGSQMNPTGPSSGSYRLYRGGSCFNFVRYCRSSFRSSNTPLDSNLNLGLRLAL